MKREDAQLLQRFVDGEASERQAKEAKALLEESSAARVYIKVLESLGEGVRAAEEAAWEQADLASAETWTRLAFESQDLVEESLDELAPLLERFHDGEVGTTERAVVLGLLEEREDVAAYLEELRALSQGLKHLEVGDEADFEGFWEGIAEGIAEEGGPSEAPNSPVAVEAFEAPVHTEMLQRYHDGEVDAAEQRQVEAWLEGGEQQVADCLEGLREVGGAVEVAYEELMEGEQSLDVWAGVEEVLEAEASGKVVSLERANEDRRQRREEPAQVWHRPLFAVAAAVILVGAGALLGPLLLGSGTPEVSTERVVIFDTIESAPGSSVMVRSPQLAGHGTDGDVEIQTADQFDMNQPAIRAEDDEAPPTVLWLLDDDDEDEDEDERDELPGPI